MTDTTPNQAPQQEAAQQEQQPLTLENLAPAEGFNPVLAQDEPTPQAEPAPQWQSAMRTHQQLQKQRKALQEQQNDPAFKAFSQARQKNDPVAALQALGFSPIDAFEALAGSLGGDDEQPTQNHAPTQSNQFQNATHGGMTQQDGPDYSSEIAELRKQLAERDNQYKADREAQAKAAKEAQAQQHLVAQANQYEEALWGHIDSAKENLPHLAQLMERDSERAENAVHSLVQEFYRKHNTFPSQQQVAQLAEANLAHEAGLWRDAQPTKPKSSIFDNQDPQITRQKPKHPANQTLANDDDFDASFGPGESFGGDDSALALMRRAEAAAGGKLVGGLSDDEDNFF